MRFVGFLGDLRFTAEDIRADLSGPQGDTRRVAIAMNEAATAAFTQFTTVHVNQSVSFFVCGEQMQSVTVQAPISSGFALSDAMPLARAEDIVAALNGEAECP